MPENPFIIFTLPRSRSYWLSHWLSATKDGTRIRNVGHDAFSRAKSVEECLSLFEPGKLDGTIETGAAFAFPLIQKLLPKARFLVLQREPQECLRSILSQGFILSEKEFLQRVLDLYSISGTGIRTIRFEDLDLLSCAKWIWSYCLELPWDQAWWEQWAPRRLEVDMVRRKEELLALSSQVEQLKQDVAEYGTATRH